MRRWPEVLLIVGGMMLLGSSAGVSLERQRFQREQDRQLEAAIAASAGSDEVVEPARARSVRRGRIAALGRIEIPRIGLSAMIAPGTDGRTLDRAVGLVRGSPLPGRSGNVSLAGHRDTFFKRLRALEPGDEIRITTARGHHAYRVIATGIVGPDRADLMRPTRAPMLTLITCYPFDAIGPAPQRFVVRARGET